jgi:hypothetical protein
MGSTPAPSTAHTVNARGTAGSGAGSTGAGRTCSIRAPRWVSTSPMRSVPYGRGPCTAGAHGSMCSSAQASMLRDTCGEGVKGAVNTQGSGMPRDTHRQVYAGRRQQCALWMNGRCEVRGTHGVSRRSSVRRCKGPLYQQLATGGLCEGRHGHRPGNALPPLSLLHMRGVEDRALQSPTEGYQWGRTHRLHALTSSGDRISCAGVPGSSAA